MAVQHATDQHTAVEFLASLASEYAAARELWWRPWDNELHFWLFAELDSYETERALHALQLALADRFHDLLFDLDIVDLKYLAGRPPSAIVPAGAEQFPLSRQ